MKFFFGHKKIQNDLQIRDLDDNHKRLMKVAFKNSHHEFEITKSSYNKNKFDRTFNDNEIIMITHHTLSNAFKKYNSKLDLKWKPAAIINKIVKNIYQVRLLNGREILVDTAEMKKIPQGLQDAIKKFNPSLQLPDTSDTNHTIKTSIT